MSKVLKRMFKAAPVLTVTLLSLAAIGAAVAVATIAGSVLGIGWWLMTGRLWYA